MAVGAVVSVDAFGRLEEGVEGVVRQVALRAARLATDEAHRFQLAEQVARALIDVQHPVDGLARCRLPGRHERRVLRAERKVVCNAGRRNPGLKLRLIGYAFDAPAVEKDARSKPPQALAI